MGPTEVEAAIKRNTDCVYFLASPLTCKKGSECEFRHSEIARLNPRDCCYWLNGNCLNPTCAFRHPPIEGYPEIPSASVKPKPYSSAPTSKSCVPCYFYFNAFCVKGDQCPFIHDVLPSQKLPKPACDASRAHPRDKKTSTGSDTGPASVEMPAKPLEGTLQVIKRINSQEIPKQPNKSSLVEELSASSESSVPECEEPDIKSLEYFLPPVEYVNGRVQFSSDQSSEELVKECNEPDSPGFDVLVDDGSEQFAYEDDADYLLARERVSERLHSHLYQNDFEDSANYDPLNLPDVGYQYDHNIYDDYDHIDDRPEPEYFHRLPEIPKERILEPMLNRNQRLPSWEHQLDVRDGVDLRNHLRKRRRLDFSCISLSSRRHHSFRTRARSRERPMRQPLPRGRLSSEVGRNMILSFHSELVPGLNDQHRQHRSRYSQSGTRPQPRRTEWKSRRYGKASPGLSSELVKGSVENEVKPAQQTSSGFARPKSLAQIKEERNRAKVEGSHSQYPKRAMDNEFAGPKPLRELLKGKKRPLLASDDTVSPAHGTACHGIGESQHGEYRSEFLDDDNVDDDDEFRKRLAHILEY